MCLSHEYCLCRILEVVTAGRVVIVLSHTIRTIVELRSRWLQFQLLSSRIVLQCHNLKAELSQLVKKNLSRRHHRTAETESGIFGGGIEGPAMRGNKDEDVEEATLSDEEEGEEEAEICSLVALNLDNGVEVSKMSSNEAFLGKH